jgi:hypothetical protein
MRAEPLHQMRRVATLLVAGALFRGAGGVGRAAPITAVVPNPAGSRPAPPLFGIAIISLGAQR